MWKLVCSPHFWNVCSHLGFLWHISKWRKVPAMARLPLPRLILNREGHKYVSASKEKRYVARSSKFTRFLSCPVNNRWFYKSCNYFTFNFLNWLLHLILLEPNIFWAFYSTTCNLSPHKAGDPHERTEIVINKYLYVYTYIQSVQRAGWLDIHSHKS
jgi:hypothetical protein